MSGGEVDDSLRRVPDDAILWRRVPPDRIHQTENWPRPQGNAFRARSDEEGVSVHVAECYLRRDLDPRRILESEDVKTDPRHWGVLAIAASVCREAEGLEVVFVSEDGDEFDAHAEIRPKPPTKKSSRLTKAAHWVHEPEARTGN
jgi:hypothetical protein